MLILITSEYFYEIYNYILL